MRFARDFFALALLVMVAVLGSSLVHGQEKPERSEYSEAEKAEIKRIEAVLKEWIVVDTIKTPLETIASMISKAHKVNVILEKEELRKVGVSEKTPITILEQGSSTNEFLKRLLAPLKLKYEVRPDGIHIVAVPLPTEK